jgi:hypothetical protein
MTATQTIKFKGNRAYRFEWAFGTWQPIAAAKAQLLLASGQAEDVTGKDFI